MERPNQNQYYQNQNQYYQNSNQYSNSNYNRFISDGKAHLQEMGVTNQDFPRDQEYDSIQTQMRLGFIRKVLGILGSQIFLTVLFCLLSMSSRSFLEFQMKNMAIFFICLIGSIVIPICLICFNSALRKVPHNYILLFTFTFFESYIVSFICGMSNPKLVFMAACMTFGMVLTLALYAFYTKTDFSTKGGALFIFGCAFLMLSIFGLFTQNKIFHIILCSIGIVMFGFYIVYDLQLIIGNKSNMLETDEYILAAFMLYTDIIGMFLEILKLLQLLSDN
jgi:FtsH-binding integral membrane protein